MKRLTSPLTFCCFPDGCAGLLTAIPLPAHSAPATRSPRAWPDSRRLSRSLEEEGDTSAYVHIETLGWINQLRNKTTWSPWDKSCWVFKSRCSLLEGLSGTLEPNVKIALMGQRRICFVVENHSQHTEAHNYSNIGNAVFQPLTLEEHEFLTDITWFFIFFNFFSL